MGTRFRTLFGTENTPMQINCAGVCLPEKIRMEVPLPLSVVQDIYNAGTHTAALSLSENL